MRMCGDKFSTKKRSRLNMATIRATARAIHTDNIRRDDENTSIAFIFLLLRSLPMPVPRLFIDLMLKTDKEINNESCLVDQTTTMSSFSRS
mmetsp:Transcript_6814/g.9921  ORF Transcript_6814/g.9921 Transcript_6814/m.9921 type:complete len:91 (+) Transcript_6814:957-1229(+)